jgi:IclR family acetate operon transcriptional repressor
MTDIHHREKSSMRSLERALQLLDALEEAGGAVNITHLAKVCRLSRATVQRILSVLAQYGYVKKRQRQYWLGAAVLPLAHAFMIGDALTRITLPVLQELADVTEETASLFVRQGFKRILVQRIDGRHPLRFVLPIGQGLPLHVGSGKVLAAALPDRELDRLVETMGEITLASGKPLTREDFLQDIAAIRKRGYSISNSERTLGIFSIAAPVRDGDGTTLAAVVVTGTSERLTPERIEALSLQVRAAAKAIGQRYGGGMGN